MGNPLNLFTLQFQTKELQDSFEHYQQKKYSHGHLQLLISFIIQLIICGILFIASNFSYSIIPLAILNLISTVLQAALSQYRFYLNQAVFIISSGSVLVTLILLSTSQYSESITGNYKQDLYFIGGLLQLLVNCFFTSQWTIKIIFIIVNAILLNIFYDLEIIAYVITGLILLGYTLNLYKQEKESRIQFLILQQKSKSLVNWEKFLDTSYQDPVFVINITQRLQGSISNAKQRPSIDKLNVKNFNQEIIEKEEKDQKRRHDQIQDFSNNKQIKGFSVDMLQAQQRNQEIPGIPSQISRNFDFESERSEKKFFQNSFKNKLNLQFQHPEEIGSDVQGALRSEKIVGIMDNNQSRYNKFSQSNLDSRKISSDEYDSLPLKFQNLACQKEFYQKVNQTDYFLQEMQRITVYIPIEQAIELQFSQELQQQNQDKHKQMNNMQFFYGKGINNQSNSSNQIASSSRLQEHDYKNPKKFYKSTLTEFIQKKIQQNKIQKKCQNSNLYFLDELGEESDFFEVSEIISFENCERQVNNGFGYQIKYYNIHLYEGVFKGVPSIIGVMKDITEQQKYFQQRYREIQKEKLIQSLVHEINPPLSKLMNCIDALNDQGIDHDHATYVAKQNSMQVYFIVNDIIDYFRLVNSQLDIKKNWFTVNQLQSDISLIFEEQMKERCINFEFCSLIDQSEKINSDFLRLKQIIVNLISLSLKYTTEGNIKIYMSYYDTKKETIEFIIQHTESFLPKEIIQQLRSSFQIFDNKYDDFTSGKNLQLLLCQGLVERIGPSHFFVKQDDGNVEIRFKIYSNYSQIFKQIDSRTNFISFNRENNQAFLDQYRRSQSKIDHSASQIVKKNQAYTYNGIDPQNYGQGIQFQKKNTQNNQIQKNIGQQIQKQGSGNQNINHEQFIPSQGQIQTFQIRNHQPSLQLMLNQQSQIFYPNFQQNQQPQGIFESACLLTEEIGEKRDFDNDQQVHYIHKDYKLKSKYDIETTNTLSKIRSTADTFEMDFLEDLKRFLNYSRILIINDEQEDINTLIDLLQTKVKEIEIHIAENSKIALQRIIDADNDAFQYSNPDFNYKLIIMSINTKSGDSFLDVRKMKKYISQLPNSQNIPVILVSKEINQEYLNMAEQVGALALFFHPLSLENLQLCLKKYNKIPSLNQIQI
ncbi:transmembrane protein, putative (macronuclear) [Tetrahymena thermophila SB210]|uniref:Transmembrane protein, putative n=1 Tax=Tetrahymena thermophila (strain SB210) TaxID=312017 RepID=I7M1R7_TETTS|nr:transmembrane protein, putative [Tetrahymena thermophila SB210]EAR97419.2 transmembrane protein, putative [Tetrahymena thermophila SB210]|eukprot:XP_001017664.2 transmembrane protein, putative [Tetrahymena thermophila SB210]